jgi:hypothetical protein
VLSEDGQRLWYTPAGRPGGPKESSLYRLPVIASLYDTDPALKGKANPFKAGRAVQHIFVPEEDVPRSRRPVQMSCMDVPGDLRQTRQVILASPRAAELDAKLGTFPFDQQEALRRDKQWGDASPVDRLALQRQWTNEFRPGIPTPSRRSTEMKACHPEGTPKDLASNEKASPLAARCFGVPRHDRPGSNRK